MGINISEGRIAANGKIGGRAAEGSIDDEGVIELGIDFKVGGLGITTDYGGAIKVTIAGQSITWGREGGLIEYNFAGFQVTVEARDCVVTETKIIAGIVVAEHTYPDPGCKLPEPPEPLEPPNDSTPGNEGVNIPNDSEVYWAIIGERNGYKNSNGTVDYDPDSMPTITNESTPNLGNYLAINSYRLPFGIERKDWMTNIKYRAQSGSYGNYYSERRFVIKDPPSLPDEYVYSYSLYSSEIYEESSGRWRPYFYSPIVLAWTGTGKALNNFFSAGKKIHSSRVNGSYVGRLGYSFPVRLIPIKPATKTPRPFLPTGNKPPVNNDCCEEILDKLDDFEEILHIDFFKKNKFPVPAYLLAPGCDPQATTEIKNYYGLFRALFQVLAHGTIISPKVAIQDTDSVKEGDQSLNSEYLSATGWAEAITKMLYEVVDDGNVATNMDIRTGVTVTQLLVAVADLSHKVDTIIDVIGVTTIRKKDIVETSFSLVTQDDKKGFDPKKDNQKIDLNDDRTTEQVLGDLLRTRKNPIVKEEIHPKSKTIVQLLEALKNK